MKEATLDRLNAKLQAIHFASPVTHVYNPLEYARASYLDYWRRYGQGRKRVVLLGMNPGPWGMAQTGVPFGEVGMVRDWLGIEGEIHSPSPIHPARPIEGWACARSEVSGRRLWGFVRERYPDPQDFFQHAYVANYCPLIFLEESGRNRTPDKLPKAEREPMLAACNEALLELVEDLRPELVVGVGKWAEQQALALGLPAVSIPHPSPANPGANSGWGRELGDLLDKLGV